MKSREITQDELLQILSYAPDSGEFTWRKRMGVRGIVGSNAGCMTDRGYLRIMINSVNFQAHRLAYLYMTGDWPCEIDHINHNRMDNRWRNLRNTSSAGNSRNKTIYKNNKSGRVGVHWVKRTNRFDAKIKIAGRSLHLPCNGSLFDGACVRIAAENRYGFHKNHGMAA
jgi:hypothetical protein